MWSPHGPCGQGGSVQLGGGQLLRLLGADPGGGRQEEAGWPEARLPGSWPGTALLEKIISFCSWGQDGSALRLGLFLLYAEQYLAGLLGFLDLVRLKSILQWVVHG